MKQAAQISRQNFNKLISNNRHYLPSNISQELKRAGLSRLLHTEHVKQSDAVKAIKLLQEKRLLPDSKPASDLWRHASIKQAEQDQAATDLTRQKYARAYIAEETSRELGLEEMNPDSIFYNPRNRNRRVLEQIEAERDVRESKIKSASDRRNKLLKDKSLKPAKPVLTPLAPLKDIDIG